MTAPTTPRPKLVLIDGHSIIHRSFHAMKQLAEPLRVRATGELTGAPFGFANTFLHMFGELHPTHVIVTLDRAGPTFRHEITDTYKATRVAMPDQEREDFSSQMRRTRQLIETFGMPIYELDGYEADDLMGTLARQAAAQGAEVWLVSMDSDIAQLVEDDVHLWMYRPYQRDSVMMRRRRRTSRSATASSPSRCPTSRRSRATPPTTSPASPASATRPRSSSIETFGSVENMIEHADEVTPPKVQKLVGEYADQLRQSKHLATIVREAPATIDLDAADFNAHYEPSKVSEFFREMEFRTLIPRLPEKRAGTEVAAATQLAMDTERNFSTVLDEHDLDRLVERIREKGAFVLDLETTTREPMRAEIVAFSIALGDGEAAYVPVAHTPRLGEEPQLPVATALEKLGPVIADPDDQDHGAQREVRYRRARQPRRRAAGPRVRHDDRRLPSRRRRRRRPAGRGEPLARTGSYPRRLGAELPDRAALMAGAKKSQNITWPEVEIAAAADCAAACADGIWRLRAALEPELDEKGMHDLFHEIEMPLVSVLAHMELHGIAIDTDDAARDVRGRCRRRSTAWRTRSTPRSATSSTSARRSSSRRCCSRRSGCRRRAA